MSNKNVTPPGYNKPTKKELEASKPETPDEISDFLAAHKEDAVTASVDVDIDDLTSPHSMEADLAGKSGASSVGGVPDPPEGVPLPGNLLLNKDGVSALQPDEIKDSFTRDFDFGTVTVTDADKDAYIHALMTEEDLVFSVLIDGVNVSMEVAVASAKENVAVADAVARLVDSGDMKFEGQYVVYYQALYTYIQVRRINDAEAFSYDPDNKFTLKELTTHLASVDIVDKAHSMPLPKWNMLLLAQRIADRKSQICNENILNREFFKKADTA